MTLAANANDSYGNFRNVEFPGQSMASGWLSSNDNNMGNATGTGPVKLPSFTPTATGFSNSDILKMTATTSGLIGLTLPSSDSLINLSMSGREPPRSSSFFDFAASSNSNSSSSDNRNSRNNNENGDSGGHNSAVQQQLPYGHSSSDSGGNFLQKFEPSAVLLFPTAECEPNKGSVKFQPTPVFSIPDSINKNGSRLTDFGAESDKQHQERHFRSSRATGANSLGFQPTSGSGALYYHP